MVEREMAIKVVLLGDPGVGKTALMRRYTKDTFDAEYKSLGLDFLIKNVKVGRVSVITQVWDTTGHERFSKLWPTFYKDADCCVLVFTLTELDSFSSLERWKSEFLTQCTPKIPEKFPFVVVGNKADLDDLRQVPPEWGCIPIANEVDYPCIETSAKLGHNVDNCFKIIVQRAIEYKHVVLSLNNLRVVDNDAERRKNVLFL